MSSSVTTPASPLIFTRYLYIKSEVEHSLIHAILLRDKEQALFWGYELYYSGHWTDTLALLSKIYDNHYKQYSNLGNFLNKKCREYADLIESIQNTMLVEANDTISCIIGTIIKNLCAKNYALAGPDKKMFIIMDNADIQKYKTVPDKHYSARLILQNVCEYTPWREPIIVNQPDNTLIIPYYKYDKIEEKYYDHWLYYASLSPIWLHRIKKWNGVQNHKTRYIEFTDDFYFEQFYQLYNYEPDEQSNIVQNRNIPKTIIT